VTRRRDRASVGSVATTHVVAAVPADTEPGSDDGAAGVPGPAPEEP
jgi:hypothetical protein